MQKKTKTSSKPSAYSKLCMNEQPMFVIDRVFVIQLYASIFHFHGNIDRALSSTLLLDWVLGGLAQVLKYARIMFRINVRSSVVV